MISAKEESIEQFKKDYLKILKKKVIPKIRDLEKKRKSCLSAAVTACVFLSFFSVFALLGANLLFLVICIVFACGIWTLIKKSFEFKIKKLIMPELMQAFPGFRYLERLAPFDFFATIDTGEIPNPETLSYLKDLSCLKELNDNMPIKEIEQSRVIPFSEKECTVIFDDCFEGEYRNVKIGIFECAIKKNNVKIVISGRTSAKVRINGIKRVTVFKGVVVRLSMNKKIVGRTIIRSRNFIKNTHYNFTGLSEVKLEDTEFNNNYSVYSTDQIEARYLITTSFMERFKQIKTAFSSSSVCCSFYGDYIYLAISTKSDLFSLGSLIKPVMDKSQFRKLLNEFVSILRLVDHFKLDEKLGL